MPDNPSGVYSLPPSYKVSNGDLTDSSQHNPPFEDVEQALTNRLHRDGRTAWTGPQNANNNKITNLASATDPKDALPLGQVIDAVYEVGDYRETVRTLDSKWLRRNGSIHDDADYPELAPLMESLPTGLDWVVRASPPFNQALYGIASSPSVIVAAGYHMESSVGSAATSSDGISWVRRVISSTHPVFDVAYGNGLFVAVGASGVPNNSIAAVSSNGGNSWSSVSIGGVLFRKVMFANGLFYASGSTNNSPFYGVIYSSPDGVVWTNRTVPLGAGELDVAYGNGIFLAANSGEYGGSRILKSTDAVTWEAVTGQAFMPFNVKFHDGKFMFAAGANMVLTEDGINFDTYPSGSSIRDAAFVDGVGWVGVGAGSSSSNLAGTSWAGSSIPTSNVLNAVIANPFSAGKAIAVGGQGVILECSLSDGGQFKTPEDSPTTGWIKALP